MTVLDCVGFVGAGSRGRELGVGLQSLNLFEAPMYETYTLALSVG